MMRPGFLLVEVVIALMLASSIAISLIVSLTQMGTVQTTIDSITDIYIRAHIVHELFDKELNGAFIPQLPTPEKSLPPAAQKPAGTPAAVPQPKPGPPSIEKPFVLTQKNNNIDTFSFITTNPTIVYSGEQKPKPHIARVMYRLDQEKGHANSYRLLRQEGIDLDIKKYTPEAKGALEPIEVITGIKSCVITLFYKQQDEKEQWVNTTKWPLEGEKKAGPDIPFYVELKWTLWNNEYKQELPFTFTTIILGQPVKSEKQPEPQPKQEAQKKEEEAKKSEAEKKAEAVKKVERKSETEVNIVVAEITDKKQPKIIKNEKMIIKHA